MKSEKVSNNIVRYTLDKEELEARKININDLKYGSDEAKALFNEICHRAFEEYGAQFTEGPIMVEAVPLENDTLSVTITDVSGNIVNKPTEAVNVSGAKGQNAFLPLQNRVSQASAPASSSKSPDMQDLALKLVPPTSEELEKDPNEEKDPFEELEKTLEERSLSFQSLVYVFDDFEALWQVCAHIDPKMRLKNSIFRNTRGEYYLIIEGVVTSPTLRKVVSLLSEYDVFNLSAEYAEQLVREHCEPVCMKRGLQKLAEAGKE